MVIPISGWVFFVAKRLLPAGHLRGAETLARPVVLGCGAWMNQGANIFNIDAHAYA